MGRRGPQPIETAAKNIRLTEDDWNAIGEWFPGPYSKALAWLIDAERQRRLTNSCERCKSNPCRCLALPLS